MKQLILEALPQTAEQLCTAIVTIVASIIAAFRKGKKAAKNNDNQ